MNYNNFQLDTAAHDKELFLSSAFPALMRKVYVWMTLALVLTGATAYGVATSPGLLMALATNKVLFFGLVIAEFALVFGVSGAINRLSLTTATLMFVAYSVINGALLSFIFLAYTMSSITSVFFITAGTFGAMSVYGYFTSRDLSRIGSFLFMALIGLIIASIVNIFLKSSGLEWAITFGGVLIFVGLTAWDTQQIKRMAQEAPSSSVGRLATLGALSLYLDFINMFVYLLRIFGNRN